MQQLITTLARLTMVWAILYNPFICPVNIILDLHNVCIMTNRRAALKQLPPKDLAYYLVLFPFQNPQKSFYKVLHAIKPLFTIDAAHHPHDDHGNLLPMLMCEWLNGTLTNSDILSTISTGCNQHPEWFKYTVEKNMVLALARMLFTPHSFITLHGLHPDAHNFVQRCKKAGHKVYVLSNWDADSFALLQKKYSAFFDLFDGIGISGSMHCAKPHPDIYTQLLTTHKLKKEDCWFIDDQLVNLQTAQQIGINTIHCPAKKYWKSSTPDLGHVWNHIQKIGA